MVCTFYADRCVRINFMFLRATLPARRRILNTARYVLLILIRQTKLVDRRRRTSCRELSGNWQMIDILRCSSRARD